MRGEGFVEHAGLSLADPVTKAGGRVYLDYPIAAHVSGYVGGEAGFTRTPSGWQPEAAAFAGISIPF